MQETGQLDRSVTNSGASQSIRTQKMEENVLQLIGLDPSIMTMCYANQMN